MTGRDVVDIDSPHRAGPVQVDRFEEQGFVRLPAVLSPATVRHFEPEIAAKVIELNTQHLPMDQRSPARRRSCRSRTCGSTAIWSGSWSSRSGWPGSPRN
jgi:hypothetical protein